MPAPFYTPVNSLVDLSPRVRLVSRPVAITSRASLHVGSRLMAHALDLSLVIGLSIYASKLLSLAMLSIYRAEFAMAGRGAEALFADAYDYANGQLLGACAGFFGLLYFVALPAWSGRTLGLGLFGLRIVDSRGQKPSMQALARRMLGCLLIYVTGGSLLLLSLRGRQSKLPQDGLSNTSVTAAA